VQVVVFAPALAEVGRPTRSAAPSVPATSGRMYLFMTGSPLP
jgi:hypothetical protein